MFPFDHVIMYITNRNHLLRMILIIFHDWLSAYIHFFLKFDSQQFEFARCFITILSSVIHFICGPWFYIICGFYPEEVGHFANYFVEVSWDLKLWWTWFLKHKSIYSFSIIGWLPPLPHWPAGIFMIVTNVLIPNRYRSTKLKELWIYCHTCATRIISHVQIKSQPLNKVV